jgi:hypothetical protein
MADKISVQIALEGGDQVEKQLTGIGKAGETMAAGISQAGEASQTTSSGFDALIEATNKLTEATTKATEAHSALSLETVKTSAEIAKLAAEIGLAGVEIVQAVRHHNTLIQTLIKLAGITNTTVKAVSLLTPELALVGVTIGSTAAAVAAGAVAFTAAEAAITKFASGTEQTNHTLQTLAATSGESFDKLQLGEAAFEQIGIKAETFRGTIAKVQETLAATDTKNLTTGMKDIVALVNEIAAGNKNITFADWVTAEDKVKGVSIAMKQAADAGKNATQVLLEFLRSADLATSIKVGAAFGLSEADVDRVRRLKGDISDLIQRIQGAGVLISPESAAAFDAMRTSIQNADSAWVRFKQSLDSTVFTTLAANFSATMNDMKAAALNGAAAIVEALNQAGRTFAKPPPEFTALLQAAGQQLQNAVTGLNSVVANLVGAAMQQAGASAAQIQAVKDQINGVVPAVNAVSQSVQDSGLIFTQWGTLAQQGANTAKAGVQEGVQIWTQWGTAAGAAGEKAAAGLTQTGTAAQSGSDKVAAFGSSITGISWDSISSAGVAAWDALTGAIGRAIDKLLTWLGLKEKAGGTPVAGGAPIGSGGIGGNAAGGLLGGRGTGTSDSNLAWVSRGEYITPARAVRQPGVLSFLEALRRGGGIPGFAAGGVADGGVLSAATADKLWNFLNGVTDQLDQALRALNPDLVNSVLQIAKMVETPMHALLDVMNQIKGNARGGLLGGRGSGTSDSNLAWVSRGEYITPARAVAQPGVLAFLEALRRSGGNLGRVLDGMGRFALGGMVPRMPAFAAGGLAGGSNVTIQFPGLPAIGGLRASSDVVDQLHRAAALAQVRSGGRKPSRYS